MRRSRSRSVRLAGGASPAAVPKWRCYTNSIVTYCESLHTLPHRGIQRDDIRPGLRTTSCRKRFVIAFQADAWEMSPSRKRTCRGGVVNLLLERRESTNSPSDDLRARIVADSHEFCGTLSVEAVSRSSPGPGCRMSGGEVCGLCAISGWHRRLARLRAFPPICPETLPGT
jgi:hypothetical protein